MVDRLPTLRPQHNTTFHTFDLLDTKLGLEFETAV